VVAVIVALVAAPLEPASAQAPGGSVVEVQRAPATECYQGLGLPVLPISDGQCPSGSKPRVTESYAWGGTVAGDSVWYGTYPNALCSNMTAFSGPFAAVGVEFPFPFETDEVACEFDTAVDPPFPGTAGDARTTALYEYQWKTDTLINRTPSMEESPDWYTIVGIRAMGAINGVVIAAGIGPALGDGSQSTEPGVHLYAFDSRSKQLIGQQVYEQWNNVKGFLKYKGVLYMAVGLTEPLPREQCSCDGEAHGQIVSLGSPTLDNPLPAVDAVPSVGNTGQNPAYMAIYKGRMALSEYQGGGTVPALGRLLASRVRGIPRP